MLKLVVLLPLLTLLVGVWGNSESSAHLTNGRIINGLEAHEGQFPYMASLRVWAKNKWFHTCGGSLVTERWILTAAHCLRERNAADVKVFLGTITTNGDGDMYDSDLLIMHEEFTLSPVRNDVGLIKLTKNVTFSDNVYPVYLSKEYVDGNVYGTASGWGYYKPGLNESPEMLQYLTQVTLTNEVCASKVNSINFYESNLCAFNKYGIGMCNGDSGSPLVAGKFQIGIASWVKLPCASGRPDVYVRVADYLRWISLTVVSNQ